MSICFAVVNSSPHVGFRVRKRLLGLVPTRMSVRACRVCRHKDLQTSISQVSPSDTTEIRNYVMPYYLLLLDSPGRQWIEMTVHYREKLCCSLHAHAQSINVPRELHLHACKCVVGEAYSINRSELDHGDDFLWTNCTSCTMDGEEGSRLGLILMQVSSMRDTVVAAMTQLMNACLFPVTAYLFSSFLAQLHGSVFRSRMPSGSCRLWRKPDSRGPSPPKVPAPSNIHASVEGSSFEQNEPCVRPIHPILREPGMIAQSSSFDDHLGVALPHTSGVLTLALTQACDVRTPSVCGRSAYTVLLPVGLIISMASLCSHCFAPSFPLMLRRILTRRSSADEQLWRTGPLHFSCH